MTYFLIATYLPQLLHESGCECLLGFAKFLDSPIEATSKTYTEPFSSSKGGNSSGRKKDGSNWSLVESGIFVYACV